MENEPEFKLNQKKPTPGPGTGSISPQAANTEAIEVVGKSAQDPLSIGTVTQQPVSGSETTTNNDCTETNSIKLGFSISTNYSSCTITNLKDIYSELADMEVAIKYKDPKTPTPPTNIITIIIPYINSTTCGDKITQVDAVINEINSIVTNYLLNFVLNMFNILFEISTDKNEFLLDINKSFEDIKKWDLNDNKTIDLTFENKFKKESNYFINGDLVKQSKIFKTAASKIIQYLKDFFKKFNSEFTTRQISGSDNIKHHPLIKKFVQQINPLIQSIKLPTEGLGFADSYEIIYNAIVFLYSYITLFRLVIRTDIDDIKKFIATNSATSPPAGTTSRITKITDSLKSAATSLTTIQVPHTSSYEILNTGTGTIVEYRIPQKFDGLITKMYGIITKMQKKLDTTQTPPSGGGSKSAGYGLEPNKPKRTRKTEKVKGKRSRAKGRRSLHILRR